MELIVSVILSKIKLLCVMYVLFDLAILDFMNFASEVGALLAKNKHVHIAKKKSTLNACSVIRILYMKHFSVANLVH